MRLPRHLYEHRKQPLLSRSEFAARIGWHFAFVVLVVVVSLGIGMVGYHLLAGFTWLDSFVNAAMLIGGMGPIGDIPTSSGKFFAGMYALYAGLVLIAATAVLMAPVLHRIFHRIHLDDDTQANE